MTGKKYDTGKLRFDLIPYQVIDWLAVVLTFGVIKYDENNWQKVERGRERYYAALMRHLQKWRAGEMFDKETGFPHLAHAFTCLAFLLWIDHGSEEIQATEEKESGS